MHALRFEACHLNAHEGDAEHERHAGRQIRPQRGKLLMKEASHQEGHYHGNTADVLLHQASGLDSALRISITAAVASSALGLG